MNKWCTQCKLEPEMKYQFTSYSENTSFSFARSIKFPSVPWNATLKLSHNYHSAYPLFFRSKWSSPFRPAVALKNNANSPNSAYFRTRFIIPQKLHGRRQQLGLLKISTVRQNIYRNNARTPFV